MSVEPDVKEVKLMKLSLKHQLNSILGMNGPAQPPDPIAQIVELRRLRDAIGDRAERRRLAAVIRQLRLALDRGIPKHRAAAALGISPQALERWVRSDAIRTVRKSTSSRELIDRDALLRLVAEVRRREEAGAERPVGKSIRSLGAQLGRLPRPNQPAHELRYEYLHTTPADRLRAGVALAETAHVLAAAGRKRREAAVG
jgi:hypothetical protein